MTIHAVAPAHGQFTTVAYEECLRRLSWENVGRIGLVEPDGVVSIYPVNFLLHDGAIVFRTTPRRAALLTRDTVTFEVDHIDDVHGSGWSVIARGPVTILDESPLGAAPMSWAPDGRTVTASLAPIALSGREIFMKTGRHSTNEPA